MGAENIRYTRNISYDFTVVLNIIEYNLMVMSNTETGDKRWEIKKIVSC